MSKKRKQHTQDTESKEEKKAKTPLEEEEERFHKWIKGFGKRCVERETDKVRCDGLWNTSCPLEIKMRDKLRSNSYSFFMFSPDQQYPFNFDHFRHPDQCEAALTFIEEYPRKTAWYCTQVVNIKVYLARLEYREYGRAVSYDKNCIHWAMYAIRISEGYNKCRTLYDLVSFVLQVDSTLSPDDVIACMKVLMQYEMRKFKTALSALQLGRIYQYGRHGVPISREKALEIYTIGVPLSKGCRKAKHEMGVVLPEQKKTDASGITTGSGVGA